MDERDGQPGQEAVGRRSRAPPTPPPLPLPASSRRPVHLFRPVPVLRRHDAALLSASSVLPVSVGATRTILGFRELEAAWIAITVSLDLFLMLDSEQEGKDRDRVNQGSSHARPARRAVSPGRSILRASSERPSCTACWGFTLGHSPSSPGSHTLCIHASSHPIIHDAPQISNNLNRASAQFVSCCSAAHGGACIAVAHRGARD